MWRIFQFLNRFGNLILFIVLEVIALILIINLNSPHKEISQQIFLEISAGVGSFRSSISDYFTLDEENEKLKEQNQELMRQMEGLKLELNAYKFRAALKRDYYRPPDSSLPAQNFQFIPCRAINNSTDRNYNYITLNKGRRHGLRKDMGILSPKGVAGRVIEVSENYALGLSVLNKKFMVSAKLQDNKNIGSLTWDGKDPEYGILDFIPQTSVIEAGDTVVTSGYGVLFPENFLIGVVESYNTRKQDGFYNIKVKLVTNFRGLRNLYLVANTKQNELDSLEAYIQEE